MHTHNIEATAPEFDAINSGEKNWIVVKNDRHYQRGDNLVIICDVINGVTQPTLQRRIGWMLTQDDGLAPGYVAFSLERIPPSSDAVKAIVGTHEKMRATIDELRAKNAQLRDIAEYIVTYTGTCHPVLAEWKKLSERAHNALAGPVPSGDNAETSWNNPLVKEIERLREKSDGRALELRSVSSQRDLMQTEYDMLCNKLEGIVNERDELRKEGAIKRNEVNLLNEELNVARRGHARAEEWRQIVYCIASYDRPGSPPLSEWNELANRSRKALGWLMHMRSGPMAAPLPVYDDQTDKKQAAQLRNIGYRIANYAIPGSPDLGFWNVLVTDARKAFGFVPADVSWQPSVPSGYPAIGGPANTVTLPEYDNVIKLWTAVSKERDDYRIALKTAYKFVCDLMTVGPPAETPGWLIRAYPELIKLAQHIDATCAPLVGIESPSPTSAPDSAGPLTMTDQLDTVTRERDELRLFVEAMITAGPPGKAPGWILRDYSMLRNRGLALAGFVPYSHSTRPESAATPMPRPSPLDMTVDHLRKVANVRDQFRRSLQTIAVGAASKEVMVAAARYILDREAHDTL